MLIQNVQAKSLVRQSYPSLFGWMEYTLNPYQGCWHDCKYCDGKSERYHMHEAFGETIKVKANAVQLLEKFFKANDFYPVRDDVPVQLDWFGDRERKKPATFTLFIGGGVCDVYQPAERKARLMRQLLQAAYDYGIPVITLTKSSRVLEDMDLLCKINQETYAAVHFTVTLEDDLLQKRFEPRASSSTERFRAMAALRNAGIPSGMYLTPMLPFLSDSEENLRGLYRKAVESRAEFVYTSGLTLTPGRNKAEFLQTISEHFPDLLPKYKELYGNDDLYGKPDYAAIKRLLPVRPEARAFSVGYENQMPYAAPRYVPEGRISSNLKLSELLLKAAYVKGTLLGQWKTTAPFYKASRFLEQCPQDIYSYTREELVRLPLAPEIHPYLIDFFTGDAPGTMSRLEREAYDRLTASKPVEPRAEGGSCFPVL
ncbi:radical SAM protein [Gorillibacterium sp. CAU 1737]|uniref:SPL family radical SAM protein n=1 Tax=Gorillibacterium sp. CAU 1737 TaxID=3140362 RepID=UPI0032601447